MTKSNGMDLEEMSTEIAKSRKEIAVLTASLAKLKGGKNGKSTVELEQSGFRHGLEVVGAKGGEVANGLSEEIKRHPLISGVTALGLGFVIAMLIFKRSS
ncbi:MAG: hypothetical protein M0R80_22765 [Proteobacteria bacterium]|nr:hypothetical protein [Pseudomonadota bacterium]